MIGSKAKIFSESNTLAYYNQSIKHRSKKFYKIGPKSAFEPHLGSLSESGKAEPPNRQF